MARPNNGMKPSKPEFLVGGWSIRVGIIESGFAAYAPCYTAAWVRFDWLVNVAGERIHEYVI